MATPRKAETLPIDVASHAAILNDIASNSLHIVSLARRAFDNAGDVDAVDVFCSAVEVLASRIGWMAEVANEQLGERGGVVGTDARDWLMPPLYRRPAGKG